MMSSRSIECSTHSSAVADYGTVRYDTNSLHSEEQTNMEPGAGALNVSYSSSYLSLIPFFLNRSYCLRLFRNEFYWVDGSISGANKPFLNLVLGRESGLLCFGFGFVPYTLGEMMASGLRGCWSDNGFFEGMGGIAHMVQGRDEIGGHKVGRLCYLRYEWLSLSVAWIA